MCMIIIILLKLTLRSSPLRPCRSTPHQCSSHASHWSPGKGHRWNPQFWPVSWERRCRTLCSSASWARCHLPPSWGDEKDRWDSEHAFLWDLKDTLSWMGCLAVVGIEKKESVLLGVPKRECNRGRQGRYELLERNFEWIDTDSLGRCVWRGIARQVRELRRRSAALLKQN